MNAEWLCYVEGQEYGPYTWPQLVQMAAAGNIVPASYIRRHHDSQWYTADQVPGLFVPAGPVNPKLAAHPHPQQRPASAAAMSASGAMKKVAAKPAVKPGSSAASAETTAHGSPIAHTPPAGMPATPLPQELPRGRVAKPNAPQPVVTTAAAPASQPAWIPVVKADASPAIAALPRTDQEPATPGKKKDNSKTMVLALGGAIAGVALVGGAALIWKMSQKPEEPKDVAVAPLEIPTTETDPAVLTEETNPTDVATSAPVTSAGNKSATKTTKDAATPVQPTPSGAADAAKVAALVSTVKGWKSADEFGKVGVRGGLMCTKLDAWLAADADGRRVQVKFQSGAAAAGEVNASVAPAPTEGKAETPAIAAPAASSETKYVATEAAPYLFVQVTINNTDVKPRPYGGWNVADTAAVLVDSAGKPVNVVPTSSTPQVKRSSAKDLLPGETLVDTIVFAVPPAGDLNYKLLLPKPAFSTKQTGAWGYEVSGPALAAMAAGPNPTNPAGGVPGAAPPAEAPRPQVAIPIPGVQEEPKAAPPAAGEPEMKKPEKPPINPNGPIPIPGLTDAPNDKPAGPKMPQEVPNLEAPAPKKK